MTTQPLLNSVLFTTQQARKEGPLSENSSPHLVSQDGYGPATQRKMKQIYTLFCSFTLFILDSWMFSAINSSTMNNFKSIQEFLRPPENIQGQQNVFQESRTQRVLIANSRTVLGAQGRLATLSCMHTACVWCGAFVYCLQVPLFPEPGEVSLMRQYRNRFYSNADHTRRIRKRRNNFSKTL